MSDDRHRCKSGAYRCRHLDIQPDGRKLAARTDQPLCESCMGLIRHHVVGNLLEDFDALRILLGEHRSENNDKIAYTRDPGIPLSLEPERLMSDLVFYADLAADMVSSLLELDYPIDDPTKKDEAGRELEAIGERQTRRRRQRTTLEGAYQRLTPYVEHLLDVEETPIAVWVTGEAVAIDPDRWEKTGPKTYIPLDRQDRRLVGVGRAMDELSGADVLLKLWELHEQIRGMFGARPKDQKDHMSSPCPFYADYHPDNKRTLYRNHGEDIIYCSKCPRGKGKHGWTHDEYRSLEFQVGVIFSEEDTMREKELEKQLAEERKQRQALEEKVAAAEQQAALLKRFFDLAATDPEYSTLTAPEFAALFNKAIEEAA